MTTSRKQFIQTLADSLAKKLKQGITIVAITGFDASGKTSLAAELEPALASSRRPIVRIAIDDFYNPQRLWKKEGSESAIAWYQNGYNYNGLLNSVLRPLKKAGAEGRSVKIPLKLHDRIKDIPLTPDTTEIPDNGIVLFEGIFLFRSFLKEFWDISIFVHAPVETLTQRGLERDTGRIGTREQVLAAYRDTYIGAHRFYMEEANPYQAADIVIDSQDIACPAFCDGDRRHALDTAIRAALMSL